jgi:hypothetical protein
VIGIAKALVKGGAQDPTERGILYQPKASFVGWLVLMIFISPFLQFLMTLFGAQVAMLRGGYGLMSLRGSV